MESSTEERVRRVLCSAAVFAPLVSAGVEDVADAEELAEGEEEEEEGASFSAGMLAMSEESFPSCNFARMLFSIIRKKCACDWSTLGVSWGRSQLVS
jgi:hypothetical protein